MLADWNILSDDLQLHLAQQALGQAVALVAGHAEALAAEIEAGCMQDRGGPDALRLLADVARATVQHTAGPTGRG